MCTEFVAKLKKARALIAKGWTQDAYARRRDHHKTDPCSPAACYWCASGALRAVGLVSGIDWESTNLNGYGVTSWNDLPGRTQAEVLAMFTNSIAALGG